MSLLPVLAITVGGGAIALLVRREERAATAVTVVALLATLAALATVRPGDATTIGGVTVIATEYGRVFLVLGALAGLGVTIIGAAAGMPRDLPAATLLGLGAATLALASSDPIVAVLAAAGGSFVAVLVTLAPPRSASTTGTGAHHLRAVAIATAIALLAAAWLSRPTGVVAAEPEAAGLALLALATAVALRWAAIPFHRWAARVAAVVPELAVPTVLLWGASVLAIVLLGLAETSLAVTGAPLAAERAVIVAVGVGALLLGVAAAYLHDDLGHILTYAIVADAGIVLLALGALDANAWAPVRLWLLGIVVTRTAFGAWAAAIRAAFGARRLRDLGGWARRAPLLAGALLAIAVATVGWPGLAVFDARGDVVAAATETPLTAIVLIGTLGHIGYFARIAGAGIGRRSAAVAGGLDAWPRWPVRGASIRPADASRLWRANRGPVASVVVVLLAGLAVLVAAGGLGGPRASIGGLPRPTPSAVPSPSFVPTASPSPSQTRTPNPTSSPIPTASGSVEPSGSVAPSGSIDPSGPVSPSGSVSPSP